MGPAEKDEAERKVKNRTLGNIRLIAELFNKGIIAERIVVVCIEELIGDAKADPSEDNVEVSLSRLSSLRGHELPQPAASGIRLCIYTASRYEPWVP